MYISQGCQVWRFLIKTVNFCATLPTKNWIWWSSIILTVWAIFLTILKKIYRLYAQIENLPCCECQQSVTLDKHEFRFILFISVAEETQRILPVFFKSLFILIFQRILIFGQGVVYHNLVSNLNRYRKI